MTSSIEYLKLFNEKANRLIQSPLSKNVAEGLRAYERAYARMQAEGGNVVRIDVEAQDPYNIDAFILTLRFFIQDNEKISFRNLSNIYPELKISSNFNLRFQGLRNKLNQYLDSEISTKINGESLTKRKILNVFIYGFYAHANPEKKEIYDEWMKLDGVKDDLRGHFYAILITVLKIIRSVAILNKEVIQVLESKYIS